LVLFSKEVSMDTQKKQSARWPFILAGCGVLALLMVCGIAVVLGAGGAWLTAWQVDRVFNRVTTQDMADSKIEQVVADLPLNKAKVLPLRGVVEVQEASGDWVLLTQGSLIGAGQNIRTGDLSAAQILFNDSSQVSMGPNTELSVDQLDFLENDQRRVIELTQKTGESTHNVAHSTDKGSTYAVRTEAGTGEAKGTQFTVNVSPDQAARFNVLEGTVEVTGLEGTVMVEAGRATLVEAGLPPSQPALFIVEEGLVTQTGNTWIIDGQTFTLHPATVVVGNPQIGDIVFVEGRLYEDGTRLADLIVLVRKSPAESFSLTGEVQDIGETEWIISGQSVTITNTTEIEDGIEAGNLVKVEGIIRENGDLLAEKITLVSEEHGLPFDFVGVIETIGTDSWLISGVNVAVYTDTVIQAGLEAGDLVQITGRIQEDGTWRAEHITRALDEDHAFEIIGRVESTDPWKVAGITFETRSWTEIADGLAVGNLAKVIGQIQADGTWLAFEIERVEAEPSHSFVLIGTVISTDPWVVNGIPLNVTTDTIIVGNIVPGMLVRVEINILPDGSWQVVRITPLADFGHIPVCMTVYATVVSVEGDQVQLLGWPVLSWKAHTDNESGEEGDEDNQGDEDGEDLDENNGFSLDGGLTPSSIVQIYLCIDENGNITIVNVIIITAGNPVNPPPYEGEKVAICHKPAKKGGHTLIVAASAVPAHLAHGDTLGACSP
jgi:hypothetical protein